MKFLHLLLSLFLYFSFGLIFRSYGQGSTPILPGNNPNPYGICELPPPGCQEIPICTYYDDCFRFDFYAPKPGPTPGTTVLKHKITNFSESTFKRAAFELPGTSSPRTPAILPQGTFRNRYNHSVVNPYNDTMIAYNAINAGTYSYGGFEVYYYIVNTADFNAAGKLITVTAEAGRPWQLQRTGRIVIDVDDCIPPGPQPGDFCIEQENTNYFVGFPFWEQNAQGEVPMSFTLINKTNAPIEYFEIQGASGAIIRPVNGSTYSSPTNVPPFTYTVSNNTTTLRFTGISTAGFVNNALDVFNFTLDAATYFDDITSGSGGLITVRVRNTSGVVSEFVFETAECGEIRPLPVTLTSFKGKLTPEGIDLTWVTASEKNNDRFEVERSTNGMQFERIGTVKGNGNASNTINYGFMDSDPQQGINYYRLRQVDFDGQYEYTRIISVKNGENAKALTVMLAPNPCFGEKCTVRLQASDATNPITIELQDLAGRIVYSKQIPPDQTTLELPKLDSGAGIYILTAKNGKYTAHQKVLFQ